MRRVRTTIAWLIVVCAASVAIAACGSSTSTVTTVIEQVPASTPSTTTATSGVVTVTLTDTQPQVTTTTAATAPCTGAALYAAAGLKEGFNANSPGYSSADGQGPGADDPNCYGGWATAGVSRPRVGTTDGLTLFEATGGTWREVTELGDVAVECNLQASGVPALIAAFLAKGVKGSSAAGCDDPDAYNSAREQWTSSFCDDAADQSGDWIAVAQVLEGAKPDYAGDPSAYEAAITELMGLARLPDTDVSSSQAAEENADFSALDGFLNTPGLFLTTKAALAANCSS